MFRLFRWSTEYNPKRESTFTSAWIRLKGLPLPLYDSAFIEAIVSTFGSFVGVDDRTKACLSVKYARACVELDVTKPIPEAVWINLPDNLGYWQAIEVETKLSYCSKCKMHGHALATCRRVKEQPPKPSDSEPRPESKEDKAPEVVISSKSNEDESKQNTEEWVRPKRRKAARGTFTTNKESGNVNSKLSHATNHVNGSLHADTSQPSNELALVVVNDNSSNDESSDPFLDPTMIAPSSAAMQIMRETSEIPNALTYGATSKELSTPSAPSSLAQDLLNLKIKPHNSQGSKRSASYTAAPIQPSMKGPSSSASLAAHAATHYTSSFSSK